MELCSGQTLLSFINEKGRLIDQDAAKIFHQLLLVLDYLHSLGVSHRDLKPENVIVSRGLSVKLIDFGLSSTKQSVLSTFCGSISYSSPEIVQNIPSWPFT